MELNRASEDMFVSWHSESVNVTSLDMESLQIKVVKDLEIILSIGWGS